MARRHRFISLIGIWLIVIWSASVLTLGVVALLIGKFMNAAVMHS